MPQVSFRNATLEDASGIAFVQYRGWHDTYKGIVSDETLAAYTHEGQTEQWKKFIPRYRGFIMVMCNEADEIIGYISGGRNRTDELNCEGEIYAFYLLKEYHGLGVGAKLFLKGGEALREMGYKSFCLWVLKGNPTVKFYHKFKPDLELCVKKDIEGDQLYELGLG